VCVSVCLCVCVVASNKPFTMRARGVNATLASLTFEVQNSLPTFGSCTNWTSWTFSCNLLLATPSCHCQLWFIYRWNYLVLRFDASHCQSNFILHSKPFCTLRRAAIKIYVSFSFFVFIFFLFFCFLFFTFCFANFLTNVDLSENWLNVLRAGCSLVL